MANQANIKAVITAEDKGSAVLKKFGDNTSKVGSALAGGLKLAGIGLVAAGVAAVAFGVSSVKAFSDSEDKIAQTNAVLKSTKGIAGVTAKSIDEISKSLQRVTKYSDEDVRSVENLLLTFTAIGKDIFPQATKTVLNMATALGEDTKSASIQLGKALQDPILGITALRRVGVNFSEKQKDVVKRLVETGQSAKAQKLILKELETEFGNSAEAAGSTLSGQLAKLKNNFNDLQEIVGGKVGDALRNVLAKFNSWIQKVGGSQGIMDSLTKSWALLTTGSGSGGIFGLKADSPFIKALLTLHSIFVDIRDGAKLAWAKIKELADIIWQHLAPSFSALWQTIQTQLLPAMRRLYDTIQPYIIPALKAIATTILVFVVADIWILVNVLNILAKTFTFALNVVNVSVNAMKVVISGLTTVFNPVIKAVMWFATVVSTVMTMITQTVGYGMRVVVNIFKAGWNQVFGSWGHAPSFFSGIWGSIIRGAQFVGSIVYGIFSGLWGSITAIFRAGVAAVTSALNSVISAYNSTVGAVGGKKVSPVRGYASGTNYAPGGMALVGEQGPELVNLPRGSQVKTAEETKKMFGGQSVNITIQAGAFMGSQQEARKYAKMIMDAWNDLQSTGKVMA